jgi:hypothetical protein
VACESKLRQEFLAEKSILFSNSDAAKKKLKARVPFLQELTVAILYIERSRLDSVENPELVLLEIFAEFMV